MAALSELCVTDPAPGDGVPLTPDWRYVVQIAVPAAAGARYDIDTYDEGAEYSAGYEWLDITARWRGTKWRRGKGQLTDQPDTGVWVVDFANTDGYFSPRNSLTAFPAREFLAAGTLMRCGYWDDTTWRPAFTGEVEDISEQAAVVDGDVWVTFTVTETIASLATIDRAEQSSQGASELAPARLARLLSDAGWAYGTYLDGFIALTAAPLQATTMAQNRLGEVKLTADSVFADVFSGRDGRLWLWTKGAVDTLTEPGGDVYVLTETPGAVTLDGDDYMGVPWAEAPNIRTNKYNLVNRVTAARVGGSALEELDGPSIGQNGERGYRRLDLILTLDMFVEQWAEFWLAYAKGLDVSIDAVAVDAWSSPEMPDLLTQLDLTSFCSLYRELPRWEGVSKVLYDVRVIAYEVRIVPQHPGYPTWTATLRVQPTTYVEI